MRWHFTPLRPIDKTRDPIQGEFFANETIDRPGEALVREGIQNALDASRHTGPVLVRIFVSGEERAIASQLLAPFLEGAWDHFKADGNGLSQVPEKNEPCPYLAFEDFGTTGLIGDVEQWEPIHGVQNHFFYFFRAEGRTDKGELDRGRWGIGKYVFPQSSRVNSIFGITVRADDRKRLLMGQAVLKSHRVADTRFSPDGWLGTRTEGKPILPIDDPKVVDEFCTIFGLQRSTEPGLSVVVPWCELDMNGTELIKAVVRHYFYPILRGDLQVIIETPEFQTILDVKNLVVAVEQLGADFNAQMRPVIELARWAAKLDSFEIPCLQAPPARGAPRWSSELIPDGVAADLRAALRDRKHFALRVPMFVHQKKQDLIESSHFDVFLAPDDSATKDRPVFVRGGIIISDVKAHRERGVRAIVVAEDRPIATLLGDAENPSHTQWLLGSHFKNKYQYGKSRIEFVRESVHEILKIVTSDETEADPHLLADIFQVPPMPQSEETPGRAKKPRNKPGVLPPVPPPIAPSPKRFRVQKISGGFSVTRGDEGSKPPRLLQIRAAYDTRRGNPLSKYSPADFEFGTRASEFAPALRNAEVVQFAGNLMLVRIDDPDFSVHVTGFDQNRDLYVRVLSKEPSDADQTT